MRAYRRYVGHRVLVRCEDITYRGQLVAVHRSTLVLVDVTAIDRDVRQQVDGRLLVPVARVLHVQVP